MNDLPLENIFDATNDSTTNLIDDDCFDLIIIQPQIHILFDYSLE